MRTFSRVLVTVAVVLACLTYARAAGPITPEQCSIINPNPIVTNCVAYLPPIVDLYGNLPYDSIPEYQDCVKERCVCTYAAVNTSITTSSIYCNSSGWMESGFTTCNRFNYCFKKFWKCINTAAMHRYDNHLAELAPAELNLAVDITEHGRTPGEDFEVTDVYRSCRLMMCAAAQSRQNCGLVTCLPNYTQCNRYMLPPPLPYTHQLCTQGCRAVLIMMALTISIVSFSFCCMCCCPAPVVVCAPIIKESSEASKKEDANGDNGPEGVQRENAEIQQQANKDPF
ncbi:hypothetical protein ABL78_0226 [Leptomonas seymouri]|uniref:Uncharacterized protein n=1 Tax=Leptomonas seymouri TaxID=5684 RepID=A0A0N1ICA2_LEPSE|nr:hypothetical protein ABL78_0226 [Leptomonas seymouri]|eukprot:KPI90630.1 hypothetical protein ABL78_0226 [Leptomonas seymouri]